MAFEYLSSFGIAWGLPTWLITVVLIWTVVWKLFALWKSARNKHIVWFIVIGILNTIGIIPILYIFIFSKLGKPKKKEKIPKKPKRKISKKRKKNN